MMFKTIKFSLIALFALTISLSITSCKKDDEGDTNANKATVGTDVFTIKSAIILDYGPTHKGNVPDPTHYNLDFYLTDGNFIFNIAASAKIRVSAELFSAGGDQFKTGSFEFRGDQSSEDIADKNIFDDALVVFDKNGDEVIDNDDEFIYANGGTVTVSGTSPNFTINFDLTLENGKTLKATYSGNFPIQKMN